MKCVLARTRRHREMIHNTRLRGLCFKNFQKQSSNKTSLKHSKLLYVMTKDLIICINVLLPKTLDRKKLKFFKIYINICLAIIIYIWKCPWCSGWCVDYYTVLLGFDSLREKKTSGFYTIALSPRKAMANQGVLCQVIPL